MAVALLVIGIVWMLAMCLALSLCAVAKEADSHSARPRSVRNASRRHLSAVR